MNKLVKLVAIGLSLFSLPTMAATVVLDITFDGAPEDIAFGIWSSSSAPSIADLNFDSSFYRTGEAYDVALSSPIGFGDGFVGPGELGGVTPDGYQFVWNLDPGSYIFTITDAAGNGLCCELGLGNFLLFADGSPVVAGAGYSDFVQASFNVATPIPVPGAILLFGSVLLGWIGMGRKQA